jgi:hypothetical protein
MRLATGSTEDNLASKVHREKQWTAPPAQRLVRSLQTVGDFSAFDTCVDENHFSQRRPGMET